MTLRFLSTWPAWPGIAFAVILSALAWMLYRKQFRHRAGPLKWILPLLRALAVFLIAIILVEPVLAFSQSVVRKFRLYVLVDTSDSMGIDDAHMDAGRKVLLLDRMGFLKGRPRAVSMKAAADHLAAARALIPDGTDQPTASSERDVDPPSDNPNAWIDAWDREVRAAIGELKSSAPRTAEARQLGRKGSITLHRFDGIGSEDMRALMDSPKFPDKPDAREQLEAFTTRRNRGDNYGQRVFGHLIPPVSGKFWFSICSDDQSELWLSPDSNPDNAKLIASCPAYAPYGDFKRHKEQNSRDIQLKKGRRYYIEALHKEGTGDDYLEVTWRYQGSKGPHVIPGNCLSSASAAGALLADAEMVSGIRDDLVETLPALRNALEKDQKASGHLVNLQRSAESWQATLREAFVSEAEVFLLLKDSDEDTRAAVERFDKMSRVDRVEELLLRREDALIPTLANKHDVELIRFASENQKLLWKSGGRKAMPEDVPLPDDGDARTDLSMGIKSLEGLSEDERAAVILVSDGQHNTGDSPVKLAKIAGNRDLRIFALGLGSTNSPKDISVGTIDAPQSVFFEDRFRGKIQIFDFMPPNESFKISLTHKGDILWSEDMKTTREGARVVPFEFPIKELAERLSRSGGKDLTFQNLPLFLEAKVEPLEGEANAINNTRRLPVQVSLRKRKALLLDGRPRWEFRYIRNLLQRNEQWEINDLVPSKKGLAAWKRGRGPGLYPATREDLFEYDVVVLGDLPQGLLSRQEMQWMVEFVGDRAGGLVLVDGRRQHLRGYLAKTPLAALLPVQWSQAEAQDGEPEEDQTTGGVEWRMMLHEGASEHSTFALVADREDNRSLWEMLPPVHWCAPVKARMDAEVMVSARSNLGTAPSLVARRYGAGRVLYQGFDESWRWRYKVGDRFHARYWNQVANWVGEAPFAVTDKHVSLDSGGMSYQPGERARIRLRLRDRMGLPLLDAKAKAVLLRDGEKMATLPLFADENTGGLYRGTTDELEEGHYELRLSVKGMTEDMLQARTEFMVSKTQDKELVHLTLAEDVLKEMTEHAQGQYYREEDVDKLASFLEPYSSQEIVESELVLWQSWWWFLPIIALLCVEWGIRKYAGMI